MDDRSSLQRLLEDDLLGWKVVAVHFVLFCVTMAFLGLSITGSVADIAGEPPPSQPPSFVPFFSVFWVAVLALHFIFTVSNESKREKAKQLAEKPKRPRLEIGDDGELVEIVEDEEKHKHSRV